MLHVTRRLAPFAFVLLLLAGTAPDVGAFSARFPNQSLGNRGADVRASGSRSQNFGRVRQRREVGALPHQPR